MQHGSWLGVTMRHIMKIKRPGVALKASGRRRCVPSRIPIANGVTRVYGLSKSVLIDGPINNRSMKQDPPVGYGRKDVDE